MSDAAAAPAAALPSPRQVGLKRQLHQAVLSHPSGAKAEDLYHRSTSTDALLQAAVASTPLDREVDVWYRTDSSEKQPRVARDAEGYPVEARRRLEILKDGQVRDLDTRQLFKQVKKKDGVRLVPIFHQMKWKTEAGFEGLKLLLDCVGLKDQYTLRMDRETDAPMTLDQWKRVCTGKQFKPLIFCGQCNQTCDSTTINSLQAGRGVGCGCVPRKTEDDKQTERTAAWNALEELGLCLDTFGRGELAKLDDGTVRDIDGRVFEPVKTGDGVRLRPLLPHVDWVSEAGLNATNLLLDCLGEQGQFKLVMDNETSALMTLDCWQRTCTGGRFKPVIFCVKCRQTCDSTTINRLQSGQGVGCGCVANIQKWVDNYDRFDQLLSARDLELVTSREEWMANCNGSYWMPRIKCKICNEIRETTCIAYIQQGHRIGCACVASVQKWVDNYDKFDQLLSTRDLELVTTAQEWRANCDGVHWKPLIKCNLCGVTCETTGIAQIQQGKRIGCACLNKTEAKLLKWLQTHVDRTVRHNMLKLTNPSTGGSMSVDFDIPSLKLAIELDGAQHFDPTIFGTSDLDGPKRDLEKERQMLGIGYQVVRLLQDDVWRERNGWDSFLLGEVKRWRLRHEQGLPAEPARFPDAPEYLGGLYAELRK
tara:strand:+ start:326 stop:2272 length:1947 start_codon:yes stop_codon:yes gene_type:complete